MMKVGKKRVGDEGIEQAGNYPPSNALSHPLGNGTCSSITINVPIFTIIASSVGFKIESYLFFR